MRYQRRLDEESEYYKERALFTLAFGMSPQFVDGEWRYPYDDMTPKEINAWYKAYAKFYEKE